MNEAINEKLNKILYLLENNPNIIKYKQLKKGISNDPEIGILIDLFNQEKGKYMENDAISSDLMDIKKKLYDHPLVDNYRFLEAELWYIVMYFNSKLSSLIDTKNCKNPT